MGRREGSELWPSVGLGADLQQDMLLEAEYHRNRFPRHIECRFERL